MGKNHAEPDKELRARTAAMLDRAERAIDALAAGEDPGLELLVAGIQRLTRDLEAPSCGMTDWQFEVAERRAERRGYERGLRSARGG